MIMNAAPYLVAPFFQPTQGAPMVQTTVITYDTPAPSMITPAPVVQTIPAQPMIHPDQIAIFKTTLLKVVADAPDLIMILEAMIVRHPAFAHRVVAAGGLGRVMLGRAVDALRTYEATGVAVAPECL